MTMKVKAVEKKLKFTKNENDPGVWRYVMTPEQYSNLSQKKVIREATIRNSSCKNVIGLVDYLSSIHDIDTFF
jgi:hypothetical protein